MEAAKIVLLSTAAATFYGIVHCLTSAHLCVEFFTLLPADPYAMTSPLALGLVWGIVGFWWIGFLLGLWVAVAARCGRRPPRTARSLVLPLAMHFSLTGVFAVLSGIVGYAYKLVGFVRLLPHLVNQLEFARHPDLIACLWSHRVAYLFQFVGATVLMVVIWRSRREKIA